MSLKARQLLAAALLATLGSAGAQQIPERPELEIVPLQGCEERALTPLLLDTVINGFDTSENLVFYRRPCGGVLARVLDLERLRIITKGRPTVTLEGEQYLLLNSFPGLQFKVNDAAAVMAIEGEPWIFYPTVVNLDAPKPPPVLPAADGALLNYGLYKYGTVERGKSQTLQNYQLTLFGTWGVLDSQVLLVSSLDSNRPLRTFTTYTLDNEAKLSSLRVGDVFTRGGALGATRPLGGVQWGRNFALNPNLITTPVTELDLAVRRHAALSLNASDLFSTPRELASLYFGNLGIAPYGPVQVVNIPSGYANRQLRLRAQPQGGTQAVIIDPDYYSLGLLRQGLYDYSVEVGRTRDSFLSDTYRDWLASTTQRYGVTQWLTVESHAEVSEDAAAAGSAVSFAVPYAGVLELGLAGSHRDGHSSLSGQWSASLTNIYNALGYRLGYRRFTPSFALPGLASSIGRKEELQASVSVSSFGKGSLFGGYTRTSTYASADPRLNPSTSFLFAGYSANFFNNVSISLFATRALDQADSDSLSLNLSLPFTLFDRVAGGAYATQAQVAVEKDLDQRTRADLRLSRTGVVADSTYNVQVSRSVLGSEFSSLYGSLLHPRFSATAQLSSFGADTGYSVGAAGAVALLGGKLHFSQPVGGSFGLLRLGRDYQGIRANGYRADADGDVLIPQLAAYSENLVRLDPSDLPLSFQPESMDFSIRPGFRSGVVLTPKLLLMRDVLIRVSIRDGERERPAPLGSYATIEGREEDFPAGDDGLIYLFGIGEDTEVVVHTRGSTCKLRIQLPPYQREAAGEVQDIPQLGPYTCAGELP